MSRLKRKLLSLLAILGAALLISAVLYLILLLITPWLPDTVKQILAELRRGDWSEARDHLLAWLDGFGPRKGFAFIFASALEVVIAPVPGQPMGLLGGFAFGFGTGLALVMTGLTLGSIVAMGLGRLAGRRLMERVLPRRLLERFDYLLSSDGCGGFFIIFLLPALPNDAVCYLAGLTKLPLKKLIPLAILGRLPGMAVLVWAGSKAQTSLPMASALFAVAMLVAALIWFFDDRILAALRGGHSPDH